MSMRLILARHGNTFARGEKVVWAGARNDFLLVDSGVQQAHRLADALLVAGVHPAAIYTGPLQRTRTYGEIVRERMNIQRSIIIDDRLNEIDYGSWSGLSDDEIIAQFGKGELVNWQKSSSWPVGAGFAPNESEIVAELRLFTLALVSLYDSDASVLIVSSNGRLRYFLTLVEDEFERRKNHGSFKVSTGNICILIIERQSSPIGSEISCSIAAWDVDPISAFDLSDKGI